jgi:hypothetical protein
MRTSSILVLAAATFANALPATTPLTTLDRRQYYAASAFCYDHYSYEVDEQKERPGEWTAVSGDTCRSSNIDGCQVGKANSVTLGVSISVGAGLDLGAIFHVSSDITWSYSETKTETVTQTCPKGGYVCGLMYKPTWVDVKGKKIKTITGSCGLKGQQSNEAYEFSAPLLIGDKPEVLYAACISDMSGNPDVANLGIDPCPEGL